MTINLAFILLMHLLVMNLTKEMTTGFMQPEPASHFTVWKNWIWLLQEKDQALIVTNTELRVTSQE